MVVGGLELGGEQTSNLPTPLSYQTLKDWRYTGSADTTLYTVPTGKKVYITAMHTSPGAALTDCGLRRDATAVVTTYTQAGGNADVRNFSTPLLFDSGVEINIQGSANHYGTTIVGWEE